MVETTMVLFSIVSLGSDVLSVASLSNSIPKLSCHVPTLIRRSDDRLLGASHLLQPRPVQLHDVEGEVRPDAELVKPHSASEAACVHQLHVVDEGVAVLPGLLPTAARGEEGLCCKVDGPSTVSAYLSGCSLISCELSRDLRAAAKTCTASWTRAVSV